MHHVGHRRQVFSAYAEVVPSLLTWGAPAAGILRVRGGSSNTKYARVSIDSYSPRTRR